MGLGLAAENLGWVSVKSAVIDGSNGGEKSPTSLVKLEMFLMDLTWLVSKKGEQLEHCEQKAETWLALKCELCEKC